MDNFAFKTLSAEVRLIKPDPAIYEHILNGLGVAASEALFVDDRENNVYAARSLGMHAIRFRSIAGLKHDLEMLGFPILPAVAETSSLVSSEGSSPETGQEPIGPIR
jgi:FMN phosphatase YigB (HAD superfamily)